MNSEAQEGPSRLFSPGERLGWEFRDRLRHWRHFPQAEPRPIVPDPQLEARVAGLRARRRSAWTWAAVGAAAALVGLLLLRASLTGGGSALVLLVALAMLLTGLWLAVWRPLWLGGREHHARRQLDLVQTTARSRGEEAALAWRARAGEHNSAEWERVNRIPEWGAVRAGPPGAAGSRIDVFGGTLRSWEGFLTTFGASMLATSPPVRVLDLSGEMVAAELCQLAADRRDTVSAEVLPDQLATSDLLAGLDAGQLTDILVESIHGERRDEHREARAMDARILGAICRALAPDLSLARVHEALLVAMGEPDPAQHLAPAERDLVAGRLFSADYVRQAHDRFRSLEAHLHPLRELGSRAAGRRPSGGRLQCLAIGEGQQVTADLLIDLAVQWAIRGLRPGAAREDRPGAVVVAGADRLRHRHLERLADACERAGVRLTYLFRHLRGDAELLLGGSGTAVFMRLGNHQEAERAARFIGLGHRFVLSRVTRGQGGGQTDSAGDSKGGSTSRTNDPTRPAATTSTSRSWGSTRSHAEETNWHYSETSQRVYEYLVEPSALQNLPDYALLVVRHGQGVDPAAEQLAGEPRLQVADCNPDIVSLPRVLTEPFPADPGEVAPRPLAIEPAPREGSGPRGGVG